MTGTRVGEPPSLPPELLQDTAGTFGLLSSAMRLHIVWVLAHGDWDVGTIARQVGGTVPTVSHHLAKLKLAGLVRCRREGRHQVYVVDDPHIVTTVRQMVDRMRERSGASRRRRGVGARPAHGTSGAVGGHPDSGP